MTRSFRRVAGSTGGRDPSRRLRGGLCGVPRPMQRKSFTPSRVGQLFGTVEFWNKHYAKVAAEYDNLSSSEKEKNGELQFDWYLTTDETLEIVIPNLEMGRGFQSRILILGCGLSGVGEALYDKGYRNIVNIDFSTVLIDRMQKKNLHREGLQFSVLDVANLGAFGDESFDLILDKGCLDAVMCGTSSVDSVSNACEEISRVLVDGGYFVSITYGEPKMRNPYYRKALFKWICSSRKLLTKVGSMSFYVYSCRKDVEKFRPPPPPMPLQPCLKYKGFELQYETFVEADVETVERARKLTKLQLVLLGINEEDCEDLMQHFLLWNGHGVNEPATVSGEEADEDPSSSDPDVSSDESMDGGSASEFGESKVENDAKDKK